jgi:hypothetical protein
MSFLDNLESTLKNLEGANERDTGVQQQRRSDERARALAAAPYAEELKKGTFANEFLAHAVKIGHASRTRINMLWMGNTLRAEARERRLELRPTADGVCAVFHEDGEETSSEIIDLKSNPEDLARRWLLD